MAAARQHTEHATTPPRYAITINSQNTGIAIASSEGFSWAFTNAPEKQQHLDKLHSNSAQILGDSQLTNCILLMVRSPIGYLRALHEQTIKEGGFESFSQFIRNQRQLILATLDLPLILSAYQKYFSQIVLLSADELRTSPETFWGKFESELKLPPPSLMAQEKAKASFAANKSLGDKLFRLAILNRHLTQLQDSFNSFDDYRERDPAEYRLLKQQMDQYGPWINRRVIEYSSPDQLKALCANFNENGLDHHDYQNIKIDAELAAFIETNYLSILDTIPTLNKAMLANYREELANAII
jgi:hypothetical protein